MPESVSGGALSLTRTFNGYGEVEGQSVNVGAQIVASLSLTRDNNGRIIQKTETTEGVPSEFRYTYDTMGRLLTVTKDGALVEEYRYDSNGTRNYEMNTARGITGRNFTYSDEDHLLTAGDIQYEYNLDGFLTDKTDLTNPADKTSYVYSSRGELLRVTLPDSKVIEYVHDPLGRRIAKKIDGAITEKFLWQGMTRLLAIYDGADNLLMRFEYADDRMPVSVTTEGVTYYLAYDQVGSLRAVADSAGNVVKRVDYDSFGNIINDTNEAFAIPFGFAGGLQDRDTGLVRFGFRDYDPDIGRWTAKDPIFFAAGDTDLYGYVLNDPVNWIDPWGLKLTLNQKLFVSIASGVGAVVGAAAFGATTWGIGSVGGAMIGSSLFGALAASLMGGELSEIANAGISGAISAAVGIGAGKVIYWLSNKGIQAAVYTGLVTGEIDSIIFGANPVFGGEVKPNLQCK